MKRRGIAILIGLCMICGNSVYASDIDSMSLEELKEAYSQLEEENNALEDQIKELKAQLFDAQQTTDAITQEEATDTEEAVVSEEAVEKTTEEFLEDIVASYNGRQVVSDKYNLSEVNSMTQSEIVNYYLECSEAERWFYDEYRDATFDDLNIMYLCSRYIGGLEKQYNSQNIWESTSDFNKFYDEFNSGYYNRAYVIVELSEYYGAPFDASSVASMKADTDSLDSLNEAETRNAAIDHAVVKQVQELLNTIGFYCGNADGISGKRTVKSIKRFQEMYGYDPVDGMIDDELVGQLEEVASQKGETEETKE